MPHCALCRKCRERASGPAAAQEQEWVVRGLRHRKETRRARVTASERRQPDGGGDTFNTTAARKKNVLWGFPLCRIRKYKRSRKCRAGRGNIIMRVVRGAQREEQQWAAERHRVLQSDRFEAKNSYKTQEVVAFSLDILSDTNKWRIDLVMAVAPCDAQQFRTRDGKCCDVCDAGRTHNTSRERQLGAAAPQRMSVAIVSTVLLPSPPCLCHQAATWRKSATTASWPSAPRVTTASTPPPRTTWVHVNTADGAIPVSRATQCGSCLTNTWTRKLTRAVNQPLSLYSFTFLFVFVKSRGFWKATLLQILFFQIFLFYTLNSNLPQAM